MPELSLIEQGGRVVQRARADTMLGATHSGSEARAAAGFTLLRTETLGIPVHAIGTDSPGGAADAAVSMIAGGQGKAVLVTFANPGTAVLARRSASFRKALDNFDLILPDGVGMCLAVRWSHGIPARRVSFDTTSLAPSVFDLACKRGLSVVLVGGNPGIAEAARERITSRYRGIRIVAVFDGYGDPAETVEAVKNLDPRIVICGMGGGQQEQFLLRLTESGWSGWGFTCGGYLDQLQSGMTYYPRWIDATNLRFAYRLVREPRRLWRRYFIDYSRFALLLCVALVSGFWKVRAPAQAVRRFGDAGPARVS